MTTPGGVPNLPPGALTIDTLATQTQDMSTPAMKARAAGRFSSIFDSSTGLSPASDITPFGILTGLFSGFNSTVANADPADIEGPEDLPGLLIDFIESLPVIGQFVGLLEAILGTYDGDDEVLLTVQEIFAPIRIIVDALTALAGGTDGIPDLLGLLDDPAALFDMLGLTGLLGGFGSGSIPDTSVPGIGGILGSLFGGIFGLGGGVSGVTQSQGFEAVAAQTDTLVGLSALVAQIQAGQDPAPSAADDFERVSTTNLGPTLWDQYASGSGTWATPNGHDASWSGNFSTDFVCRYKLTQATTDAMTSTIVLGSTPDSNLVPLPANGHDDVWVRLGAFTSFATRTGVRLRVSGNGTWRLSAFVNGAEVVLLASGSLTRPAAGAILSLTVGTARNFVARLNGTVIPGSNVTEIGTASQLGAAFRSYGLGGRAEYVVFFIPPFFWLSKPGSMRQWTAVG